MNKVIGSIDFTYRVNVKTYAEPGYEEEALHRKAMSKRGSQVEVGKRISNIEIEENAHRESSPQTSLTPLNYYLQGLTLALRIYRTYLRHWAFKI